MKENKISLIACFKQYKVKASFKKYNYFRDATLLFFRCSCIIMTVKKIPL